MVIVKEGQAIVMGDSIDLAIDTVTFLGSINKMKQEDYEHYLVFEAGIKALFKEHPKSIDDIKEFAINMTEIFN